MATPSPIGFFETKAAPCMYLLAPELKIEVLEYLYGDVIIAWLALWIQAVQTSKEKITLSETNHKVSRFKQKLISVLHNYIGYEYGDNVVHLLQHAKRNLITKPATQKTICDYFIESIIIAQPISIDWASYYNHLEDFLETRVITNASIHYEPLRIALEFLSQYHACELNEKTGKFQKCIMFGELPKLLFKYKLLSIEEIVTHLVQKKAPKELSDFLTYTKDSQPDLLQRIPKIRIQNKSLVMHVLSQQDYSSNEKKAFLNELDKIFTASAQTPLEDDGFDSELMLSIKADCYEHAANLMNTPNINLQAQDGYGNTPLMCLMLKINKMGNQHLTPEIKTLLNAMIDRLLQGNVTLALRNNAGDTALTLALANFRAKRWYEYDEDGFYLRNSNSRENIYTFRQSIIKKLMSHQTNQHIYLINNAGKGFHNLAQHDLLESVIAERPEIDFSRISLFDSTPTVLSAMIRSKNQTMTQGRKLFATFLLLFKEMKCDLISAELWDLAVHIGIGLGFCVSFILIFIVPIAAVIMFGALVYLIPAALPFVLIQCLNSGIHAVINSWRNTVEIDGSNDNAGKLFQQLLAFPSESSNENSLEVAPLLSGEKEQKDEQVITHTPLALSR